MSLQPFKNHLVWSDAGNFVANSTKYYFGRGGSSTTNGYTNTVNNFGFPIRITQLRVECRVVTAQAAKTVSWYVSKAGSPASSSSPSHTVTLSMAATGEVVGEDDSVLILDVGEHLWVQGESQSGTYLMDYVRVFVAWEPAFRQPHNILTHYSPTHDHSAGKWLLGIPHATDGGGLIFSDDYPVEFLQISMTYLPTLAAGGTNRCTLKAFQNGFTDPTDMIAEAEGNVNSLAWREVVDNQKTVFAPGDEFFWELTGVYDGVNPWTVTHASAAMAYRWLH